MAAVVACSVVVNAEKVEADLQGVAWTWNVSLPNLVKMRLRCFAILKVRHKPIFSKLWKPVGA